MMFFCYKTLIIVRHCEPCAACEAVPPINQPALCAADCFVPRDDERYNLVFRFDHLTSFSFLPFGLQKGGHS